MLHLLRNVTISNIWYIRICALILLWLYIMSFVDLFKTSLTSCTVVLPNRSTFSGSESLIVVSLYHATIHSWDSLDLRLASPEFMCVFVNGCVGVIPPLVFDEQVGPRLRAEICKMFHTYMIRQCL